MSRSYLLARGSRELARRGPSGGVFARLVSPYFARIALEAEAADRLRRAYQEGPVVHVMRSRRVLDPLFLLDFLQRLGLPLPEWMHEHYASRLPATAAALIETVRLGGPALLFLRRPRTLTRSNTAYSEGFVEALVALQREVDRPIQLVPEALSWRRKAVGLRRTILDVAFGDPEAPGRLRELIGFLLRSEGARFHVGAPVNLATVLERQRSATIPLVAKKIRWSILNHLAREETIRLGPPQRPAARTHQLVLNDPMVQRQLVTRPAAASAATQRKRAEQIIRRLAADMRYGWIRILDVAIDRIWNDIYDGIVVDRVGLRRVWEAARLGPVVLAPSHKSHVDYLCLSQVFFKDGMMPPYIAAGDNLSFWPLGAILRRGGAFFIRRSFKGDRLYSAICAAYVKRLLKDGAAVEFFIEGGRSRSGKLLQPKLGLLGMCVDPVCDGALADVSLIPVSISYEKIVEAGSYARELEGGAKPKENVGALLSARKVLRSRYGRVYVDFDEPISLRAFAAARGFEIRSRPESAEPPDPPTGDLENGRRSISGEYSGRRDLIAQLGHRIVFGINRVTRVTPTGAAALVLLAEAASAMGESEMHLKAGRLIELLSELGARLSSALEPETRAAALREALGRLSQDGLLQILPGPDGENIFQVERAGRRALDFYKNNIVHFLVPASIVSLAVLSHAPAHDPLVRDTARRLSRLLKFEFSFSAAASFDQNFDSAVELLIGRRILERSADSTYALTHVGAPQARELGGQIAVFLEAQQAIAGLLARRRALARSEKELQSEALALVRRQAEEGRIRRAEAASQLTIQNCIKLLLDFGILERAEGGKLRVTNEGSENLQRLAQELQAYLRAVEPS